MSGGDRNISSCVISEWKTVSDLVHWIRWLDKAVVLLKDPREHIGTNIQHALKFLALKISTGKGHTMTSLEKLCMFVNSLCLILFHSFQVLFFSHTKRLLLFPS